MVKDIYLGNLLSVNSPATTNHQTPASATNLPPTSISLPLLRKLNPAANYFECARLPTNRLSPHQLHSTDIRQTSTVRMLYVKNTRPQGTTDLIVPTTTPIQRHQPTTRGSTKTPKMDCAGDAGHANFNKQLDLRLGLKGRRSHVINKPPTAAAIGGGKLSATMSSVVIKKSPSPAPMLAQHQRVRRALSLSSTSQRRTQKSPSSPHKSKRMESQKKASNKKLSQYVRACNSEGNICTPATTATHISLSTTDATPSRLSVITDDVITKLPVLGQDSGFQPPAQEMEKLGLEGVMSTPSDTIYAENSNISDISSTISIHTTGNTKCGTPHGHIPRTRSAAGDAIDVDDDDSGSYGSPRRDDDTTSVGSNTMDDYADEKGEDDMDGYFDDDDDDLVLLDSLVFEDASYEDAVEEDVGEDDALEDDYEDSGSNTTVSQSTASQPDTDVEREPAIIPSLFANCPGVINFVLEGQHVEKHPPKVRKKLRWKFGAAIPLVVKKCIMRSGFRRCRKRDDWIGYYGKHMKGCAFKEVKLYQKVNHIPASFELGRKDQLWYNISRMQVNHIPGSFQMGRKDRLWRNVSRFATRFGRKEFSFLPQTYVLPNDRKELRANWDETTRKQKYIVKPPASARGIGIKVISKWNQVPTKKPCIVQKYLSKPLLINGTKFDIRLYVYVSSVDPLRVYLYEDGLARFATHKYSSSMNDLSNRFMHLTNYSINKNSGLFQQNDDVTKCLGHKWSLKALMKYLREKDYNTTKLRTQIKDIIVKTLISVEPWTNREVKVNCRKPQVCHEVFGFDVMIDANLRPWILEVNVSPSLHSNSTLDAEIKGGMVKDMFNLAGFQIPTNSNNSRRTSAPTLMAPTVATSNSADTHLSGGSGYVWMDGSFNADRRFILNQISLMTKSKHNYFKKYYKKMTESEASSFMLERLTVNDVRMLCESEDEYSRRGKFERVFPTTNKKYLDFFEQFRYYNVLLHTWEVSYAGCREKGISILQELCQKNMNQLIPREIEMKQRPVNWNVYVKGRQSAKIRNIVQEQKDQKALIRERITSYQEAREAREKGREELKRMRDALRTPRSRISVVMVGKRKPPASPSKPDTGVTHLVPPRQDFNASRLATVAARKRSTSMSRS